MTLWDYLVIVWGDCKGFIEEDLIASLLWSILVVLCVWREKK